MVDQSPLGRVMRVELVRDMKKARKISRKRKCSNKSRVFLFVLEGLLTFQCVQQMSVHALGVGEIGALIYVGCECGH